MRERGVKKMSKEKKIFQNKTTVTHTHTHTHKDIVVVVTEIQEEEQQQHADVYAPVRRGYRRFY